MKSLWLKENEEDTVATVPNGCTLSEDEQNILIRLAGKFSQNQLKELGFSKDDSIIIAHWSYGI